MHKTIMHILCIASVQTVSCILQIQPNGIITFTSNSTNSTTLNNTNTPKSLPIKDLDFIAPYWFDAGILDENDCSHILKFY